jgi:NAD(P)H dehydrogenase (quinone)
MAKVWVVYDSRSGNTERMASAIAEGAREVEGMEAVAKKANNTNVEELVGADGIIMGFAHVLRAHVRETQDID